MSKGIGICNGQLYINGVAVAYNWFQNPSGGTTNGALMAVANTIYFGLLTIAQPTTFSEIAYDVGTADGSNNSDIGLFSCPSKDCSQPGVTATPICDIGAQTLASTGTGAHNCVQTHPITIQPGTYIFAGCSNGTTLKWGYSSLSLPLPFSAISITSGCTNGQLAAFTTPSTGISADAFSGVFFGLH